MSAAVSLQIQHLYYFVASFFRSIDVAVANFEGKNRNLFAKHQICINLIKNGMSEEMNVGIEDNT